MNGTYENYKGPNLTKAILNDIDITKIIQEKYGENNDWQGKLWKYNEIFGNSSLGKKIYCEFHSDDGRKYWFNSWIDDNNNFFNPPMNLSY